MNIQRADVYDWLKKNKGRKQYDSIFTDAPFDRTSESKYRELISQVLSNKYLKENAVFVLEHNSRLKLEHPNISSTRKYGNISFSFIHSGE